MKAHVTAAGMVPVPQEVRERLGFAPGSLVDLEISGQSLVIRRAAGLVRGWPRAIARDQRREAYASLWFWRRTQP